MKYLLLLLLMPCAAWGYDNQMILDGGIGVFNSGKKSLSETKTLSLGVQEDLYGPLMTRAVTGLWIDNAGSEGHKGSVFMSYQLGFEVNSNGLVAGAFTGPAVITTPDVLLGGRFQFMDDLHLGIQDKDSNYIGLAYRHLSSAGIEMPNIGRDFLEAEIRFPF